MIEGRIVDVQIDIHYNMEEENKTLIYTNATAKGLEELLANWMQDQAMRPSGLREAATEREVYFLRIGYFLESDSFAHESDAGNLALEVGIVGRVLGMLSTVTPLNLSDRPSKDGPKTTTPAFTAGP